jgi:hypothetical protein
LEVKDDQSLILLVKPDGSDLGRFKDILEVGEFVKSAVADGRLPPGSYWHLVSLPGPKQRASPK